MQPVRFHSTGPGGDRPPATPTSLPLGMTQRTAERFRRRDSARVWTPPFELRFSSFRKLNLSTQAQRPCARKYFTAMYSRNAFGRQSENVFKILNGRMRAASRPAVFRNRSIYASDLVVLPDTGPVVPCAITTPIGDVRFLVFGPQNRTARTRRRTTR